MQEEHHQQLYSKFTSSSGNPYVIKSSDLCPVKRNLQTDAEASVNEKVYIIYFGTVYKWQECGGARMNLKA
jgi:hypothetical protein